MIYEEILLYHFPDFKKQYEEKISNNLSVINHILKGESAKIIDPEADDDYPIWYIKINEINQKERSLLKY